MAIFVFLVIGIIIALLIYYFNKSEVDTDHADGPEKNSRVPDSRENIFTRVYILSDLKIYVRENINMDKYKELLHVPFNSSIPLKSALVNSIKLWQGGVRLFAWLFDKENPNLEFNPTKGLYVFDAKLGRYVPGKIQHKPNDPVAEIWITSPPPKLDKYSEWYNKEEK